MSYTHYQMPVQLGTTAIAVSSTGDKVTWGPGYTPMTLRAVAFCNAAAVDNAITIKGDKRTVIGSDSGRGDGDAFTLTVPNPTSQGEVIYKDGLNVEILPTEEIVIEVTDAGTTGDKGRIVLFVEPRWDLPANNSMMEESA